MSNKGYDGNPYANSGDHPNYGHLVRSNGGRFHDIINSEIGSKNTFYPFLDSSLEEPKFFNIISSLDNINKYLDSIENGIFSLQELNDIFFYPKYYLEKCIVPVCISNGAFEKSVTTKERKPIKYVYMILDLFVDCDDYVALLAALTFITKKECKDVKFIFVVNAFRSLQRTLLASFVIQSYFRGQGYEDRYLIVCGTNAQDTYFRMDDDDDEEKLFKGSNNGYNVVDYAFGKKLIEAFNSKDTIMEYHNYYDCCDYKQVKLEQYNLNDFFESGDELRLCVCSSTEDIIAFLNLESIREKGVKIEAYIQGTCYANDGRNSDFFTSQVDLSDTRIKPAQNTDLYNNAKYSRKFFDFLSENNIEAVFCDKTSSQFININPSELYNNITGFMGDGFKNSELKRISIAWLSLWKIFILNGKVFTKERAKNIFGKRCDKDMTEDKYYENIEGLIKKHNGDVKSVMEEDNKKVAELYNGTLLYDLVTTLQCLNSLLNPIYGTSIYDSLGYVYDEETMFKYVNGNQNLSDFVYNMMNFLFDKDILGDFNEPFAQKTSHRACFKCRGKIIN